MILAIIEAGLSRPRSPELMMAPILGEPFIWRQIERVQRAQTLTRVIVALSSGPHDDRLCGYLTSRGLTVFRGDAADAVGGYAKCAMAMGGATHVVSLRADTPLIDPRVIDEAVRCALASEAALVCNTDLPTYPRGFDIEVVAVPALLYAAMDAQQHERGSGGAYLRNRPEFFDHAGFEAPSDWSGFDWSACTVAGFAFARAVFEALYPADPDFGLEDVVAFLQQKPELDRQAYA